MSALGAGDWVQVVHGVEHERAALRAGDVHCVEAVDIPQDPEIAFCGFDDCHDGGVALVGVGGGAEADCFFCINRFRPMGGNSVTAERRVLANA